MCSACHKDVVLLITGFVQQINSGLGEQIGICWFIFAVSP